MLNTHLDHQSVRLAIQALSLSAARRTSAHVGAVFLQSRARANGARVIVKWIGHLPVSNECLLWLLGDMNCAKTDEPWRLFRCFNSEPGCHQGANIRQGGTNNQPDEAVAVIRVLVAQLASVRSAWWFECLVV